MVQERKFLLERKDKPAAGRWAIVMRSPLLTQDFEVVSLAGDLSRDAAEAVLRALMAAYTLGVRDGRRAEVTDADDDLDS